MDSPRHHHGVNDGVRQFQVVVFIAVAQVAAIHRQAADNERHVIALKWQLEIDQDIRDDGQNLCLDVECEFDSHDLRTLPSLATAASAMIAIPMAYFMRFPCLEFEIDKGLNG